MTAASATWAGAEAFNKRAEPPRGAGWMKPFLWRDPASFPRRQWLYGGHYIRKYVTCTMAPGGVGKSSLAITEALSLATGRPLLGVPVPARIRVWYFNGEDPAEETERRVMATAKHFGLARADLEGWLFLGSGRDEDLVIAEQTRDGVEINEPNAEALAALFAEHRIDLAIIDPFVSAHQVSENDNGAINAVAKRWAALADQSNVGMELVHHMRKRATGAGDAEMTVEDGRGAVSLLAAARSARVLNVMSANDADKVGIENRRSYFKVENGKSNLAPPPEKAEWRRLIGVDMGNGGLDGMVAGDSVGVVVAWDWPDHAKGVRAADTLRVQQVVAAGRFRENAQARDWVGYAVAEALQLDAKDKRDLAKIKALLKRWMGGALVVVTGFDAKRNERSFVEVGEWVSTTDEVFE